ncbi:MAG: response regulator [Lewinellaceae bacterium]|nr:response regulator [Lewinellaceae bacterium]
MIKAVIIDDEQHSIETLCWKIENYCPEVSVQATFENPAEGVAYLKKNSCDLLFLDIEMPRLNGFDVLEEIGAPLPFDVIFITAYDNFGIQAVKFSALDYLLKPVQNKELKEAVEKHLQKNRRTVSSEQADLSQHHRPNAQANPSIARFQKKAIEYVDPAEIRSDFRLITPKCILSTVVNG